MHAIYREVPLTANLIGAVVGVLFLSILMVIWGIISIIKTRKLKNKTKGGTS